MHEYLRRLAATRQLGGLDTGVGVTTIHIRHDRSCSIEPGGAECDCNVRIVLQSEGGDLFVKADGSVVPRDGD